MNSWSGPGAPSSSPSSQQPRYHALVVDSGPIIKESDVAQWRGRADAFYTVPAVVQEIRDARARNQLSQKWIPLLNLQVKEPSAEAMQRVSDFSKLTGDYPSLSAVDLQVLALVVDLEREGCGGSLAHVRTTPKRTVGLGSITSLNSSNEKGEQENKQTEGSSDAVTSENVEYDVISEGEDDRDEETSVAGAEVNHAASSNITTTKAPPSSWAKLVNHKAGSEAIQVAATTPATMMANLALASPDGNDLGGQWDDAPEDLDPMPSTTEKELTESVDIAKDLESEFPSLAAAATVPFDDDDKKTQPVDEAQKLPASVAKRVAFEDEEALQARLEEERRLQDEERQRRKEEALKPVSKSGKLYNSFRKYNKLMKPAPVKLVPKKSLTNKVAAVAPEPSRAASEASDTIKQGQSRILGAGGAAMMGSSEDMKAEDDDGEGWITSPKDIRILKNQTGGGPLDPIRTTNLFPSDDKEPTKATAAPGPTPQQRAACTTTDFAMQNVLLQMGMILLSIDGMQIRRLKSWVLRCGACFKIHTDPMDPNTGLRRMFCSHCGSDMMQRVSASVDGKTGRLKLHFSAKKQAKHTSARGTKFSLPKAGTGNRFQGDLLLREDQLLMGAWHQKVKKNGGGQSRAHAQSIFGKDIASNVGCQSTSLPNDIQVGFGRRNPNASKGRERRGKKKKSSDRACGLRRY